MYRYETRLQRFRSTTLFAYMEITMLKLTLSNTQKNTFIIVTAALMLAGCNNTTATSVSIAESSAVTTTKTSSLARNWKGETTCRKGSASRSYAVYSTLISTGPSTFQYIVEIPGRQGTSTINFDLSGNKVSGLAQSGAALQGTFSNDFNNLTYSAPRRADGLKCVIDMEVEQ